MKNVSKVWTVVKLCIWAYGRHKELHNHQLMCYNQTWPSFHHHNLWISNELVFISRQIFIMPINHQASNCWHSIIDHLRCRRCLNRQTWRKGSFCSNLRARFGQYNSRFGNHIEALVIALRLIDNFVWKFQVYIFKIRHTTEQKWITNYFPLVFAQLFYLWQRVYGRHRTLASGVEFLILSHHHFWQCIDLVWQLATLALFLAFFFGLTNKTSN